MNKTSLLILLALFLAAQAQKRNFSGQQCPSSCVCFRKTVRCMKVDLSNVPLVSTQTTLLDLRHNKIRRLKKNFFLNHKHMKSLLLNDNSLTKLQEGIFVGLDSLKHLYLHKNRINYIEPKVFQGLLRLEHLYLHNNDIGRFEAPTFSNLPSLELLYLYKNHIEHVPPNSFEDLPKLKRLRLDSNALVCDCRMIWFSDMIKASNWQIAANCKYPFDVQGKLISSMDSKLFKCKPLEIMEGPENIEVTYGKTAKFSCRVQGEPSTNIIWMHDEKEVDFDDKRHKLMEDGTLMIQEAQMSDAGFYECMVKSSDGMVKSRKARMTVLNPEQKDENQPEKEDLTIRMPKFLVTPQNTFAEEGAPEVRFFCKADGNPKPHIIWSKNGIFLTRSEKASWDLESFVIRDVSSSDSGRYKCDAYNQAGWVSAEADLTINASPIFTIHPNNVKVSLGAQTKLECVAVGSPPLEITWFKENLEILSDNRIRLSQDNTILEIREVRETDAGLYICEARNRFGYREVSATLQIERADHSPRLIYKPYDMEAIVGTTVEIPCKGEGNPSPGLQWRKDGENLQRTGRWKTSISGNLYLLSVRPEDQGRYECVAINQYGSASASGYLTVKEHAHLPNIGVGDKFVKVAFNEATQEIDKAINHTIEMMFSARNGSRHYSDIFRFVRYPKAPQRELARAAEIYERTLVNIRKHLQKGLSTNITKDFDYKEILSPEHIELVAQLSGCMAHRPKRNCSDMCFNLKYRAIDGTCNNFQNPSWGASNTAFRRILKPIYENGFSTPIGWNKERKYNGFHKPGSRVISTSLIKTEEITSDTEITHMVMQWGQFLDHDLDHATPSVSSESWDGIDCKKSCEYAAPCYPIDVPQDDPRVKNRRCIDFVRSSAVCGSGMTSVFFESIQPREQINQLTSYIDASQVYGYDDALSKELRDLENDLGLLKEGPSYPGQKASLPYDTINGMDCRRDLSESNVNCFLAGDIRVNEQVGLTAMHTVWLREHNRIAAELRRHNAHWDGETLFQEARKIVGAAMQHITYKHWLPVILGPEGMTLLGNYHEYNPNVNPSIANVFATAALRFGHSLINPILHRLNGTFQPIPQGHLALHKAFFSPWRLVEEGGIDPLLRGLFTVPAKLKKPDQNLNSELTEKLFKTAHAVALDLAAINIQRSRDHGIPGYLQYRRFCNLSDVQDFDDLSHEISNEEIRNKLRELYGHPENIDVWVGGILEDQVAGGKVGPLFRCLLIEQFRRLRDGDRFWYENPSTFKPEQLIQIKQYTLGHVLCETGDNITEVTGNVFKLPELQGGYTECEKLPQVDFSVWAECCDDCRSRVFNSINRFKRDVDLRVIDSSDSESALKERIAHLEDVIAEMGTQLEGLAKTVGDMKGIMNFIHFNSTNLNEGF